MVCTLYRRNTSITIVWTCKLTNYCFSSWWRRRGTFVAIYCVLRLGELSRLWIFYLPPWWLATLFTCANRDSFHPHILTVRLSFSHSVDSHPRPVSDCVLSRFVVLCLFKFSLFTWATISSFFSELQRVFSTASFSLFELLMVCHLYLQCTTFSSLFFSFTLWTCRRSRVHVIPVRCLSITYYRRNISQTLGTIAHFLLHMYLLLIWDLFSQELPVAPVFGAPRNSHILPLLIFLLYIMANTCLGRCFSCLFSTQYVSRIHWSWF